MVVVFPVPSNSPWPGIIKIFPASVVWLVTSRLGTGKPQAFFLQVQALPLHHHLHIPRQVGDSRVHSFDHGLKPYCVEAMESSTELKQQGLVIVLGCTCMF